MRHCANSSAYRPTRKSRDFASSVIEPERFLVLQTEHLEVAARLWAQARQSGQPTADAQALDGDVILAAQAQGLGLSTDQYIVATTNTAHLNRFVPAADWTTIVPGS